MNQKNGKNSLGLDSCFEDQGNPIDLFKKWFSEAEKNEINDPNAFAVGTADKNNQPNVRMVLLKGLSEKGFVFYTNFNSQKGKELKSNPKASMCFHWKSLRRQVRILGKVEEVSREESDKYYNSRPFKNKIGAWASSQSELLDKRETFLNKVKEFEIKFKNQDSVPRPPNWSGWRVIPNEIEFWLDGEGRIHERLVYLRQNNKWTKKLLYP
ncbi:MAG: pyridoxamine 5'-phosphate oxidase [Candidatus Pelagibacter sp. TMED128]|nr:MAG: pyridoxamine 5'-phosphate oxidase [Candidatus Pelagibacter sp. TMED128]|tara:strand:+ start:5128 stop:5760 length:633 start_codon:yes stop_codon:yes gene_type:complete